MVKKKLAAVLVLGALALAPMAQSSQAADSSPELSDAAVAALTPKGPVSNRAWIQGVVRDQFGERLPNIIVEAYPSDDTDGSPVASDETYEQPGVAGSIGFYRLVNLRRGDYTLHFTSDAKNIEDAWSSSLHVRKGNTYEVNITLTRVLKDTKTGARLHDDSITISEKGKVDVSVSSKATKKPTGDVEIRDGNKVVGSDRLKAGDRGDTTITLKKLGKGSYDLKAYFLGSQTLKESHSRAMTLTVKKPRHSHRPNAW